MCLLILRRYSCHEKKWLARCANPDFRTCVASHALPWVQEWYDSACNDCMSKGCLPEVPPSSVLSSNDDQIEQHPDAQAAATAYARSLCGFLSDMFNNSSMNDQASLTKLFKTAAIETLCKMCPEHHPVNDVFCHCDEASLRPELRNFSSGLRFQVVKYVLSSSDDKLRLGPAAPGSFLAVRPNFALARIAAADQVQALRAELITFSATNTNLRGVQVLARWMPLTDRSYLFKIEEELHGVVNLAMLSFGGKEGWCRQYLDARTLDRENGSEAQAVANDAYRQRRKVLQIACSLVTGDSGLSSARRKSVYRMLLDVLDPRPLDPGACPLGEDFVSLMHGSTWNIARDDANPREYMGSLFSDDIRSRNLTRQLKNGRAKILSVEMNRVRAAKGAVFCEMGEADFTDKQRLAVEQQGCGIRCFLCTAVLEIGPGLPPSASLPQGDPRAHRAVYLKCGHNVGLNCWIRYCRMKNEPAMMLDCPLCHKVLGPWPQPIPEPTDFRDLI